MEHDSNADGKVWHPCHTYHTCHTSRTYSDTMHGGHASGQKRKISAVRERRDVVAGLSKSDGARSFYASHTSRTHSDTMHGGHASGQKRQIMRNESGGTWSRV